MSEVRLTINDQEVVAEPGERILPVALRNGINIPHLCYDPRLEPYGACRMCMVEIEGMPEPVTSCTTEVREGMIVRTDTEQLEEIRKTLVELLLYDHPRDCLTCAKAGTCELQDLAYDLGIEDFTPEEHERPVIIEDVGNAVIYRDPSKCILCGKCVRICREVQGVGVLDFAGRGYDTQVIPAQGGLSWGTDCELCGQCVDVCPTGALMVQKAMDKGREKDYVKVDTVCPYCGVGCNIQLNVLDGEIVRVTADLDRPPNYGNLCVKGRFGYEYINSPERLKAPMIRKGGELVETTWDEALDTVAERMKAIRDEYGPESVAFISSCKCTNEENYLMQKLARQVFGSHNVDECARACHATTVAGLVMSFGSGAMTNSIGEIKDCDLLFVIGSNTTEGHPIIGLEMKKAYKRGAKIIVADPREIPLVEFSELHIAQRPGTDIPLLNAMMKVIIEEGLYDEEFVTSRTEGFEELRETVSKYDPEEVAEVCRVPAEDIRTAARMYATADKAAIFYTMGITEHTCGTDNVRTIANLAMLTGHVGRESTGVNPLRGQNNVQGACDVGTMPTCYPGYQSVTDEEITRKFSNAYGTELSTEPGLTITGMLHAAHQGKLKGLYVMGEDIVVSEPFEAFTREAVDKLEFLVVQDILPCETGKLADVVLPAASFAEKDGTFTNTERRIQRVRQAIPPVGDSKPDWQILCEVAKRLGYDWDYDHPSEIWDEMAALTPLMAGVSYDRLEPDGLQWPCPTPDHPGTKFLHKDKFARGLGKFWALEHRPPAEEPDEEYPFVLSTGITLYHYNAGTMSRRSTASNERQPEAFVEINPEDAEALGLAMEEKATVATRRGEVTVVAYVTDRVKPGVIWMPFHWAEQAANVLTIDAYDNIAETAEYKVCAARVKKAEVP